MKTNVYIIVFAISLLLPSILNGQTNSFINAKIAYEKGLYGQAVQLLNEHLSSFPKHDKALELRSESYLQTNKYQMALDDINKLKVSANNNINLLYARAYAGLQKNDLAIDYLNKYLGTTTKLPEPIIKSFPEFQALKKSEPWSNIWKSERYTNKEIILNNAKYAIKSGNFAEAADRLDEYLAKYTKSAEAYYLRGNIYFNAKEYKQAWDCYDKGLKINPNDEKCLLAQTRCDNKLGKNKSALDLVNTILNSDSLYIEAYWGRAESLVELGEIEKAKADIGKYRAYYPENADAEYLEAYIDTKAGDYLNAIANYGKLIKSNPANADYFVARANAYMETKTYKYAIKDYSMALDINPKNIQVFKQKAKAHQLLGEKTQACNEWQHAANLGDVESMDNLHKYCK